MDVISGRQIGKSPGQSNKVFRGRPTDVVGGCPWDVLGTNICRLGGLYYHNDQDDKILKKIFIWSVHGVIMLEINTPNFSKENHKPVRNSFKNLDKAIKDSGFTFNHASKITM